jgi:zinc protease
VESGTFGLAALPPRHPDYAALQVLNHILASGDFDSRLMEEIRVKRGLAYSVQARIQSDSIASLMLGGLATRNEIMGQALGVLRDVLAQTVADGPTPEQFSNAKQYLAGSYLLDFDSNAGMAAALLRIRLAGQAPDLLAHIAAIEKVGLDDVKRVARDILMDDRLVVTVVGQPVLDR